MIGHCAEPQSQTELMFQQLVPFGSKHVIAAEIRGRKYETILELGVYPGQILAYLASAHGLRATGLEYVAQQAIAVRQAFPEVEVIEGDLFSDDWRKGTRQWDVVCSFGLVEHWADPRAAIQRQLQFVAPVGVASLQFPIILDPTAP